MRLETGKGAGDRPYLSGDNHTYWFIVEQKIHVGKAVGNKMISYLLGEA